MMKESTSWDLCRDAVITLQSAVEHLQATRYIVGDMTIKLSIAESLASIALSLHKLAIATDAPVLSDRK